MSLTQNTTSLQSLLETINSLPDYVDTSGTAVAADIYTGKTATVNNAKVTGTNPYNAANVDPAVTSALAALAEKGVDTTGAGLANLATLIAGIEAGGGGDFKVCAGKVVFAEKQNTPYVITHNLGVVPSFAYIQSISPRIYDATSSYQLRLASGWLKEVFETIKDDANISTGVQTSFTSNASSDAPYTNRDITGEDGFFNYANETTITFNFKSYGQIAYAGQVFVYLFVAF